ncbi:MAG: hypothetical protein JNJ59_27470 [Deltaproteobacteria bacterium]|jgi:hypothetical protein|nr:hypothetical protein [Deltaproteobacteria bacterium]
MSDAEAQTAPKRSDGERMVLQFELCNLALAVLAFVIVHVVAGEGAFLWGTAVGGLIGVLNLRAMVFLGRRILRSQTKSRAVWATLFVFKLAVLCTVVWLCLDRLPISSLGFLVGFSTLLPAALLMTAIRALEKPPESVAPVAGSRFARPPAPSTPSSSHGERRL